MDSKPPTPLAGPGSKRFRMWSKILVTRSVVAKDKGLFLGHPVHPVLAVPLKAAAISQSP